MVKQIGKKKTWFTKVKIEGYLTSGKWFDDPHYRIVANFRDEFGYEKQKTLRTWPKTEANADKEIKRLEASSYWR